MDYRFKIQELSDKIDGLLHADFNTKQEVSCPTKVYDSESFCISTATVSITSPSTSTDRKFAEEPLVDDVKICEGIGGLNYDAALGYLSRLLLEEDTDERINMFEDDLALLSTEKVFDDIIRQEYYSRPEETLLHDVSPPDQLSSITDHNYEKSNPDEEREQIQDFSGHDICSVKPPSLPTEEDPTSSSFIQCFVIKQIQKGIDDAKRFVPNIGEFFNNQESSRSIDAGDNSLRTKTNPNYKDIDQLGARARKKMVHYSDQPIRNELFDKVLLFGGQKYIEEHTVLRQIMQKEMKDQITRESRSNLSECAAENYKNLAVDELVNLQSLLIYCSQSISGDNRFNTKELIHEIKKHSSPNGDWLQRLAYYFVDGLEARLNGTANEISSRFLPDKLMIIETLKAFRMDVAISPCKRAIAYFANQTILNNISKDTKKVHIISYGVRNGFQWPAFFEHFSNWDGMPPTIRITIVEVPEPGFRPSWKVDLVGRRLADYARSFNVPLEYEGIVSKWENVEVENLKITNGEVVIAYCVTHSEKLSDETLGNGKDSPRDIFLNTIRKIKPRVFIHSIINGSYNLPLFPARFRAALSFYSSMFEMLDCNLPRGNPERLIIERYFLMPAAINAIAFEGPERVDRPETYRQWHARQLRAGLVPLPVDSMIKNNLKEFVREHYHKDIVVDHDDSGWLLLGWKGRIWYGLSTWKAEEI